MAKKINGMTSDEAYALLDDVPSEGSDVSDASDIEFDDQEIADILENNNDFDESEDEDQVESEEEPKSKKLKSDELEIKWTQDVTKVLTIMPFQKIFGPNVPEDLESPLDFFLHLFTRKLLEKIEFETNLYFMQKTMNNNKPTTVNDIKCFLGMNMLMGIKKMPSYRDFWSSRIELRDSFISSCMSRDRFGWLLTNLHINDNIVEPKKGSANYDKLYKIRPMLDELSDTYKNSYLPSKEQCVDESMIKFKGRSSLRQYMPKKPIKRGYKMWVRANKNGYISQFQIYTGKIANLKTEKNLGQRVVKDMTRDLIGKYHEVYFDNFFNSVSLLNELSKDQIYACGTARSDRKHTPSCLKKKEPKEDGEGRVRMENK